MLERWIGHFLGVAVTIEPKGEIDDKQWVWHVGLDAEASGLLNDLYNRVDVDDERMGRLLCLFELRFTNPADMRAGIAGRPVYLAMAMDAESRLRLKPQNLLLNLPLGASAMNGIRTTMTRILRCGSLVCAVALCFVSAVAPAQTPPDANAQTPRAGAAQRRRPNAPGRRSARALRVA